MPAIFYPDFTKMDSFGILKSIFFSNHSETYLIVLNLLIMNFFELIILYGLLILK